MLTLWTVLFFLVQCVKTENNVPNAYVIEFHRPINSFATKRHIHSKRSIFYNQLSAYNISYDIRHEYNLINAVSIEFKTAQDSALFFEKALDIKRAWPVVSTFIHLIALYKSNLYSIFRTL